MREGHDLQLLRDVDTRWASTAYMIARAIILRQVSVPYPSIYSDSFHLGHDCSRR